MKLAGDMAASGGDIRIDASGKLSLAQASSQGDLKIAAQAVELNGKTYAGGSAEIRSAEELVNRQSLAARERIALEAAHTDNAGVIEAGVEPDERRNARGDLELRSGTLRNAGSLVASRALEAKASQALDNQGGSLKGRPSGSTAGTWTTVAASCSPRANCGSRRAAWTTARTACCRAGTAPWSRPVAISTTVAAR